MRIDVKKAQIRHHGSLTRFVLAGLVSMVPVLSSCSGYDCDASAYSSVGVQVLDQQDQPIQGAKGSYIVARMEGWTATVSKSRPCESAHEGGLICGFEESGYFTIHITHPDYNDETAHVHVTEDSCHVHPEGVTVHLSPKQ